MKLRTNANTSADEKRIAAVLEENEKRVNRMSAYIFAACLALIAMNGILNWADIFKLETGRSKALSIAAFFICIIPLIAYISGKLSSKKLRWLNLTGMVAFASWIDFSTGYNSTLIMAVPIIFAALYFSKRTTVKTYIATAITFGCSAFIGSLGYGMLDSNHVSIPDGTVLTINGNLKQTLIDYGFRNSQYTEKMIVLGYVPKLLLSILLFIIAYAITKFGYDMLVKQAKQTAESTMISTELKLAGELQTYALPSAEAINGKYNFEIAASMNAAREAGGDFYDFAMIDDTHLALVIADVCGKSVPAAMFMMLVREKLHSEFAPGRSPAEILFAVNNSLYENNRKKMFVTIWLGIVDITTGRMVTANGGHEDPILQKASGCFTRVVEKHGIALGIRRDKQYTEQELKLEPGDVLVQYTDGVTEAKNESCELFGADRLLKKLNEKFAHRQTTADEIDKGVREQVADFVGSAEQFDDITTLVFKFHSGV